MSINTSTIIELHAETKLDNAADLRRLTDGKAMQLVSESYRGIDITKTFPSLVDCGKHLQLALFAADEQRCSKDILKLISRYQNAVHSSFTTCYSIIASCVMALQIHQEALQYRGYAENDPSVVFPAVRNSLAGCYDTATKMEKAAKTQAEKFGNLMDIAETALCNAVEDKNASDETKKKYEEEIQQLKADQKKNETRLAEYNRIVAELARDKAKKEQQAETARNQSFILDMTAVVMGGFVGIGGIAMAYASCTKPMFLANQAGNQALGGGDNGQTTGNNTGTGIMPSALESAVIDQKADVEKQETLLKDAKNSPDADTPEGKEKIKQAEAAAQAAKDLLKNTRKALSDAAERQSNQSSDLEEKAAMFSKKYYEMMEAKAEAAAQQAKDLETLKHMSHNKTEVEQAIFLLRFAYGILGEVKTTFTNVQTFWNILASDCMSMSDRNKSIMMDDSSADTVRYYKEKLDSSAQNWACVGHLSILAYDTFAEAKKTVDSVMKKLPTETVTVEVLKKLIDECEPRVMAAAREHMGGKPPKAIEYA